MEERITTLHPQGKQGVNISQDKYIKIKEYILNTVSCHGSVSYKELDAIARKDLDKVFDGSVSWYLVTVKLDLEARGILERVPWKSGHAIKLRSSPTPGKPRAKKP